MELSIILHGPAKRVLDDLRQEGHWYNRDISFDAVRTCPEREQISIPSEGFGCGYTGAFWQPIPPPRLIICSRLVPER